MTTTVLRTVPCWACGHRIGPEAGQCPYCGCTPRRKLSFATPPAHRQGPVGPPTKPASIARPVGRCARCGGRMSRDRRPITRILARLGFRLGGARPLLACSSCGHRERSR
jgi:hypothetical protein